MEWKLTLVSSCQKLFTFFLTLVVEKISVYGNTYMYLLLNTQAICAAWILLQAVHCSLTLYQRGLIIFLQSKSCSG